MKMLDIARKQAAAAATAQQGQQNQKENQHQTKVSAATLPTLLQLSPSEKRGARGATEEEKEAKREHVVGLGVELAVEDLRRLPVARAAGKSRGLGGATAAAAVEALQELQVRELGDETAIAAFAGHVPHEDVGWLDVAMDLVLACRRTQGRVK